MCCLIHWTRRVHRPFRGDQSPESQVQGQMCCGPHPQVQRLCAEGLIPNSRSNVLPYSLGLLGLTDPLDGVPVPKFKVTCAAYLIPKFKAKCAALFIRKRVQKSNVLPVSSPSSRSNVLSFPLLKGCKGQMCCGSHTQVQGHMC